jgi:hypothetical protein
VDLLWDYDHVLGRRIASVPDGQRDLLVDLWRKRLDRVKGVSVRRDDFIADEEPGLRRRQSR